MTVDEMNDYDRHAWEALEKWRIKRLTSTQRRVMPQRARDRLAKARSTARDRFDELPRSEQMLDAFRNALDGLVGIVNRVGEASLRRQAVVSAFDKRGHEVVDLADIGRLDLSVIDEVKPRLDMHYTLASATEGAVAGLVVSGGEILAAGGAVFGAGAGAAPGAGTVAATMAADTVAVLAAMTRAVAHTAAYYGYDTELPQERIYALGVLNFGIADQAGKGAAYVQLNKIVQALARRASWQQLNKNGITRVVTAVYKTLGMHITRNKLGQAVPVAGIVLGAGLNARLLAKVTSEADHLYRARFLREKYGIHAPEDTSAADSTADTAGADADTSIPIMDIVAAELDEENEGGANDAESKQV